MNTMIIDPVVKLFDTKNWKLQSSVDFLSGSSFIMFHPKLSNNFIFGSTSGAFQMVDLCKPGITQIYQVRIYRNNSILIQYRSMLSDIVLLPIYQVQVKHLPSVTFMESYICGQQTISPILIKIHEQRMFQFLSMHLIRFTWTIILH